MKSSQLNIPFPLFLFSLFSIVVWYSKTGLAALNSQKLLHELGIWSTNIAHLLRGAVG